MRSNTKQVVLIVFLASGVICLSGCLIIDNVLDLVVRKKTVGVPLPGNELSGIEVHLRVWNDSFFGGHGAIAFSVNIDNPRGPKLTDVAIKFNNGFSARLEEVETLPWRHQGKQEVR